MVTTPFQCFEKEVNREIKSENLTVRFLMAAKFNGAINVVPPNLVADHFTAN